MRPDLIVHIMQANAASIAQHTLGNVPHCSFADYFVGSQKKTEFDFFIHLQGMLQADSQSVFADILEQAFTDCFGCSYFDGNAGHTKNLGQLLVAQAFGVPPAMGIFRLKGPVNLDIIQGWDVVPAFFLLTHRVDSKGKKHENPYVAGCCIWVGEQLCSVEIPLLVGFATIFCKVSTQTGYKKWRLNTKSISGQRAEMPVFQLNQHPVFPPADLAEPEGLLAVGGDLSPLRLLEAYRQGIFPWYEQGEPILWWSPHPRLVLFPKTMHVSRRLQRTINSGTFTITADTAFERVIAACAAIPRRDGKGTWLGADMQAAYILLHQLGFAHSVECWQDGALAGGLYGICLDRVFFGESMFSAVRDASKTALTSLAQSAQALAIELIDCQVSSEHLMRLGAEEIGRDHFLRLLRQLIRRPQPQEKWRLPYTGKEGNGTADAKWGKGSHEQDVKPTDT